MFWLFHDFLSKNWSRRWKCCLDYSFSDASTKNWWTNHSWIGESIKIISTILCFLSLIISQTLNYNIDLIHNITFENASNNFGVSDVWGFTDETGIEYAIVGYQYGTSIIDVSSNHQNTNLSCVLNIQKHGKSCGCSKLYLLRIYWLW